MANYTWVPVTLEAAFPARDGAGALVFENRMWLLGGWNPRDKVHFPRTCSSDIWSSSDGQTWRMETPAAPWEGRHTAGYVVHRDRMWVIGGDAIQGHYQNDVWSSEDGVRWELICADVPWGNRVLHYTVAHADRIWVMGGQTLPQFGGGAERFYRDVWNSADGRHWTRVADDCPWAPRGMIGGSAVFQGRIWILGGGTYDTPTTPERNFFNDVWSTADGRHWECHVQHASWEARQYHEVAVFDDRLWVMEGYHPGGNRQDVHWSSDGVSWHEVPRTPWAPRHAASVFVYQDTLWMVAGNNLFSDVWKIIRQGE